MRSAVSFYLSVFHQLTYLSLNLYVVKIFTPFFIIQSCHQLLFLSRRYTYTISVHCRKIYNLFAWALETGRKTSLWWAFLVVLQRVQINFTFNDHVRMLYLSFNIKRSKTTTESCWIKRLFSKASFLTTSPLILLPFLSAAQVP
jgi:hypothetical protein